MKAKISKGVYNLNPTQMVMKLGGEQQREANSAGPVDMSPGRNDEIHTVPADTATGGVLAARAAGETKIAPEGRPPAEHFTGVEKRTHAGHTAMRTRLHHNAHNHGERKLHEEHHNAVKRAKGK